MRNLMTSLSGMRNRARILFISRFESLIATLRGERPRGPIRRALRAVVSRLAYEVRYAYNDSAIRHLHESRTDNRPTRGRAHLSSMTPEERRDRFSGVRHCLRHDISREILAHDSIFRIVRKEFTAMKLPRVSHSYRSAHFSNLIATIPPPVATRFRKLTSKFYIGAPIVQLFEELQARVLIQTPTIHMILSQQRAKRCSKWSKKNETRPRFALAVLSS